MKNIVVTGKDGQLGSEFQALAAHFPEMNFHFSDYKELDITNVDAVFGYFEEVQPDLVINCAAYTAVDKAEEDADKAEAVNATGVKHLVEGCEKFGSRLIHISTDYVFDGSKNVPYTEEDAVQPLGMYGETKRAGELAVLDSKIQALVLRTSWVYSSSGNNFVKTMLRLGAEREALGVVYDQAGSPTYARDLAVAILEIAQKEEKWPDTTALYHFSNEGAISWFDFAVAIMEEGGLSCKVNPILSAEYPTPTARPHYSVLDKGAVKKDFGIEIPYWRVSLKECITKLIK
ncbi:dTDP-4-dehydrorhamnose reductase [Algoriphagus halophytocola]|uniref:dTDP-4-dehydrorhamnose reductase n=1 Tax=Algoriphagus halophytocola TaxID=2991499 RepID=A0ABY6MJA4_9BACT|nr:dTDP-4-dehydrorhamnose reductase [Algoriphagus sp. TR-M5]UZD23870.1 dTDP-4-dehydrorhamnose reductase [Algoriphagus sp. TR-M5]